MTLEFLLGWTGFAAIVAVFIAGAVQGVTGFGFNMLAAPLLAVISPVFVPGPMLVMAGAVCIGATLRDWRDVDCSDLGFSLLGRFVAAIGAALAIGTLSPHAFSGVFGLAVLLAVILSLLGTTFKASPASLFGAGAVSGFMGTLTSIGAPPMALVYQNAPPARMRATLNAYFFVGSLISIAALAATGGFGRDDLVLGAFMTPFAMLGLLASGFARGLLTKARVKPLIIAISFVSALVLLARAWKGLL
ncbi:protein of unknown function DUF81 (plasmid) [Ketogulonicigenium robustum]|uniref:Probable membrane transporter protein n=1 Tax=Ketogulonicigenium robustum TaxID=92947 RepID=A0A1W6P3B4_9RHOB|nr:sulfite exporter TauE/SafE family protein [Ketogulonicigenium robustum]ARO15903.1 protein of unknown function DUF81 [Ketogulonicigenium robustum]